MARRSQPDTLGFSFFHAGHLYIDKEIDIFNDDVYDSLLNELNQTEFDKFAEEDNNADTYNVQEELRSPTFDLATYLEKTQSKKEIDPGMENFKNKLRVANCPLVINIQEKTVGFYSVVYSNNSYVGRYVFKLHANDPQMSQVAMDILESLNYMHFDLSKIPTVESAQTLGSNAVSTTETTLNAFSAFTFFLHSRSSHALKLHQNNNSFRNYALQNMFIQLQLNNHPIARFVMGLQAIFRDDEKITWPDEYNPILTNEIDEMPPLVEQICSHICEMFFNKQNKEFAHGILRFNKTYVSTPVSENKKEYEIVNILNHQYEYLEARYNDVKHNNTSTCEFTNTETIMKGIMSALTLHYFGISKIKMFQVQKELTIPFFLLNTETTLRMMPLERTLYSNVPQTGTFAKRYPAHNKLHETMKSISFVYLFTDTYVYVPYNLSRIDKSCTTEQKIEALTNIIANNSRLRAMSIEMNPTTTSTLRIHILDRIRKYWARPTGSLPGVPKREDRTIITGVPIKIHTNIQSSLPTKQSVTADISSATKSTTVPKIPLSVLLTDRIDKIYNMKMQYVFEPFFERNKTARSMDTLATCSFNSQIQHTSCHEFRNQLLVLIFLASNEIYRMRIRRSNIADVETLSNITKDAASDSARGLLDVNASEFVTKLSSKNIQFEIEAADETSIRTDSQPIIICNKDDTQSNDYRLLVLHKHQHIYVYKETADRSISLSNVILSPFEIDTKSGDVSCIKHKRILVDYKNDKLYFLLWQQDIRYTDSEVPVPKKNMIEMRQMSISAVFKNADALFNAEKLWELSSSDNFTQFPNTVSVYNIVIIDENHVDIFGINATNQDCICFRLENTGTNKPTLTNTTNAQLTLPLSPPNKRLNVKTMYDMLKQIRLRYIALDMKIHPYIDDISQIQTNNPADKKRNRGITPFVDESNWMTVMFKDAHFSVVVCLDKKIFICDSYKREGRDSHCSMKEYQKICSTMKETNTTKLSGLIQKDIHVCGPASLFHIMLLLDTYLQTYQTQELKSLFESTMKRVKTDTDVWDWFHTRPYENVLPLSSPHTFIYNRVDKKCVQNDVGSSPSTQVEFTTRDKMKSHISILRTDDSEKSGNISHAFKIQHQTLTGIHKPTCESSDISSKFTIRTSEDVQEDPCDGCLPLVNISRLWTKGDIFQPQFYDRIVELATKEKLEYLHPIAQNPSFIHSAANSRPNYARIAFAIEKTLFVQTVFSSKTQNVPKESTSKGKSKNTEPTYKRYIEEKEKIAISFVGVTGDSIKNIILCESVVIVQLNNKCAVLHLPFPFEDRDDGVKKFTEQYVSLEHRKYLSPKAAQTMLLFGALGALSQIMQTKKMQPIVWDGSITSFKYTQRERENKPVTGVYSIRHEDTCIGSFNVQSILKLIADYCICT